MKIIIKILKDCNKNPPNPTPMRLRFISEKMKLFF